MRPRLGAPGPVCASMVLGGTTRQACNLPRPGGSRRTWPRLRLGRIVPGMRGIGSVRRAAFLGVAATLVIGCDLVDVRPPDGRATDVRLIEGDPCRLHVLRQEGAFIEEMEPPYVTDMVPPGMAAPPVAITFGGEGWQQVEVIVVGPTGLVDDVYRGDGAAINRSAFVAFPVDLPGTWRFRVTELVQGCRREFAVEVRDP